MQKIRQVLHFAQQGFSKRKIARLTGVHRNIIDKYLSRCCALEDDLSQVLQFSDEALSVLLWDEPFPSPDLQRQADFEAFFPYIQKELKRVGVTRQLIHQEYLGKYPQGYRYSQFCDLILRRLNANDVSMVQPCKTGELMQVDFAGKKLTWCDPDTGELVEGEVLIVTLPYSGMTFVKVLHSQRQEDFVSGIRSALEYFGGTPACLRLDNLKSGVIKADRYEPNFNALLLELCNHYQMGLDATRPAKPKDKPHVERHVQIVYQRIYAPLRDQIFHSAEQINAAIKPLLEDHQDRFYRQEKMTRRDIFIAEEKKLLKPLPDIPFQVKLRKDARVQKNYHVWLSHNSDPGHYYSVPFHYVGKQVQIVFDNEQVEIYHDYKRIAIHSRSHRTGRYTTLGEHMPPQHQAVANGMDPVQLIKRAASIGQYTELFVKKLLDRGLYCQQNFKSCQGVFALIKKYGAIRLEQAAERALLHHNIRYKTLCDILEKNLDQIPTLPLTTTSPLPVNPTVRGSKSYQ
jgi:transposase